MASHGTVLLMDGEAPVGVAIRRGLGDYEVTLVLGAGLDERLERPFSSDALRAVVERSSSRREDIPASQGPTVHAGTQKSPQVRRPGGHFASAQGGTRTRTPRGVSTSSWCVYQFHHLGDSGRFIATPFFENKDFLESYFGF